MNEFCHRCTRSTLIIHFVQPLSDDTAEKTQWLGIIDAVSRSALAGIELTMRWTGNLSHYLESTLKLSTAFALDSCQANVTPFLESQARGDKGWLQIRSKETTRLRQDGLQGKRCKWQVKLIAGLRPLCAEETTPNLSFLSTNTDRGHGSGSIRSFRKRKLRLAHQFV